MNVTRRGFVAAVGGIVGGLLGLPAWADELPKPFVVYDNELKNNWQNRSWAKVQFSVPAGDSKPAKVEGDAWSGLALHHDAIPTAGFTKLVFFVNGGGTGGQTLSIKPMIDGKWVDTGYTISPKAKTWTIVEVPLKDIKADNKSLEGIVWQAGADGCSPYYITKIQLE